MLERGGIENCRLFSARALEKKLCKAPRDDPHLGLLSLQPAGMLFLVNDVINAGVRQDFKCLCRCLDWCLIILKSGLYIELFFFRQFISKHRLRGEQADD